MKEIVIATQDHWPSLIAVAAAKAGKDMDCEKPMAGLPRHREADDLAGDLMRYRQRGDTGI